MFLTLRLIFGRGISRLENALAEAELKFDQSRVIRVSKDANFFGQQSRGKMQIRGNGVLMLTKDELYFRLALPNREFSIPLANITQLSTVNSHLGKSVFRPLLHVSYQTPAGQDAIAWWVPDPDGWITEIETARKI